MITDQEYRVIIKDIALFALSDGDFFDSVAERLDLSDEAMLQVRGRLEKDTE